MSVEIPHLLYNQVITLSSSHTCSLPYTVHSVYFTLTWSTPRHQFISTSCSLAPFVISQTHAQSTHSNTVRPSHAFSVHSTFIISPPANLDHSTLSVQAHSAHLMFTTSKLHCHSISCFLRPPHANYPSWIKLSTITWSPAFLTILS